MVLSMDLARNTWSAAFAGVEAVGSEPITLRGSDLSLGRISAEWVLSEPGSPGNNFMLFDNLRLVASAGPLQPPAIRIERVRPGILRIQATGAAQRAYLLEATSDFLSWIRVSDALQPNSAGVLLFPEIEIAGSGWQFYRCREETTSGQGSP
jgi:hypothetical protein